MLGDVSKKRIWRWNSGNSKHGDEIGLCFHVCLAPKINKYFLPKRHLVCWDGKLYIYLLFKPFDLWSNNFNMHFYRILSFGTVHHIFQLFLLINVKMLQIWWRMDPFHVLHNMHDPDVDRWPPTYSTGSKPLSIVAVF